MSLRPEDIVEATRDAITEMGPVKIGDRHTVRGVSEFGNFIVLHGAETFVRADGWKLIERPKARRL